MVECQAVESNNIYLLSYSGLTHGGWPDQARNLAPKKCTAEMTGMLTKKVRIPWTAKVQV